MDRFYFLHLTLDLAKTFPSIDATLLDTRLLKNELNQNFVGSATAFDTTSSLHTSRLDPEGVRVSAYGTFFISDEYGPYVLEFDRQGNLVRRIAVPSKFGIANPSGDPIAEITGNSSGRLANRGLEGLAITPNGGTLIGNMQNALFRTMAWI